MTYTDTNVHACMYKYISCFSSTIWSHLGQGLSVRFEKVLATNIFTIRTQLILEVDCWTWCYNCFQVESTIILYNQFISPVSSIKLTCIPFQTKCVPLQPCWPPVMVVLFLNMITPLVDHGLPTCDARCRSNLPKWLEPEQINPLQNAWYSK